MAIDRFAAFSDGETGGNSAGVVICDALPGAATMQAIAAEIGYSETAFAAAAVDNWRVRYFAPTVEVDFCGHATIALGAALALRHGDGTFKLQLNRVEITVEGRRDGSRIVAALQSPPTRSEPAPIQLVSKALAMFSYTAGDLNQRIPPAMANGGADHLILALRTRELLSAMRYDMKAGRSFMTEEGIGTVSLIHAETPQLIQARIAFAIGGIYEDPATGAAAAAFAGYLRDLRWPHRGVIEILQGEDMGMRSRLRAEIPDAVGASIRVSGTVRII